MKKIITSLSFVLASISLFAQKDSSGNLNGMFKKASSLFGKNLQLTLHLQIYPAVKLFQD